MLASQVKCPLMISDLGTYVLTISNDGITESDNITIVLYTSACTECTGLVCVDKVGTVALNTIKNVSYSVHRYLGMIMSILAFHTFTLDGLSK